MCDCYEAKCEFCDEEIPVHIGDFNYDRDAVNVFCEKHLPKFNATIFTNINNYPASICKDKKYNEIGWKCAISLCNGEIEPNREDVHPNVAAYTKAEILPRMGVYKSE